MPETCTIQ